MPVVEQEERYEEEFPTFEKSFNNQIEDQSKHESFSQMHDSFPPQSPEMQEQFDKLSIHANTSRNDSFHASSKLPLHSASSSITKKSSPGEASSSTSQNFFKEDLVDTDYENLNFVR